VWAAAAAPAPPLVATAAGATAAELDMFGRLASDARISAAEDADAGLGPLCYRVGSQVRARRLLYCRSEREQQRRSRAEALLREVGTDNTNSFTEKTNLGPVEAQNYLGRAKFTGRNVSRGDHRSIGPQRDHHNYSAARYVDIAASPLQCKYHHKISEIESCWRASST
jgi:hypothetical protein